MNRWLALLVAIVAGAAVAFAASIAFVGVTYGILWIYVFGDDSWPAWVDSVSNIVLPLFGLGGWATVAWLIWRRLAGSPATG